MSATIRRVLLALALIGAAAARPARAQSSYEQLQAFSAVLNFVRLNYADSVAYPEMVRAAIEGVLRSLDPHSYFLARADYERRSALERGELAVTGLVLEMVDGRPTVLGVSEGSPAARARIQPGDRLVSVDDTTAAGLDVQHLALKLAGEKGSRVRLSFVRGPILDPDTFAVTLRRDDVKERAVIANTMADSITGYIRLASFTATAGNEVDHALHDLKGHGMRRVILDLRGDPGGLVFAAVDVAGLFFPKQTVIFHTRGRRTDADHDYRTGSDGGWRDLPLIVLIDDRSASAAEALAGSLQDHDRALILGRRSFGKALMQQPFFLQTGDVVMLTVGHVLTPSGRFIQRRYSGLEIEQYYGFRGTSGVAEDTGRTYRTDDGRPMKGGGGIAPDIALPAPPAFPVWWSVAADSSFDTAVADSVAQTLPATPAARAAWLSDSTGWQDRLLGPFLARTRAALKVEARLDDAQARRITRNLAARVAEVRWGVDAGQAFRLRNDADIQAGLTAFPRLAALLAPTTP